jgi:hypothetical protein
MVRARRSPINRDQVRLRRIALPLTDVLGSVARDPSLGVPHRHTT